MATVRHRRWWASTARLWPRRSGSAARGTEREQISLVDVADASFMMPLSMEETPPTPPSTGMGSSARSCGRPRLPSSGDRGRSDCMSCRSRGNACCVNTVLYTPERAWCGPGKYKGQPAAQEALFRRFSGLHAPRCMRYTAQTHAHSGARQPRLPPRPGAVSSRPMC